jgi:hypothetical protein
VDFFDILSVVSQILFQVKKSPLKNRQKGSSRNVFLIIVAILLVGGAFVFAEYRNKKSNNVYKAPQITATNEIPGSNLDSDSDGMKDWEEILVGSDPKDPKSKVALNSSAQASTDLTKTKEPLTQTDLISRDFFARYMELRQLGSASDALSQAEIAGKTVGNIVLPTPKSYVMADITTKPDNDKESIKQYGNEVATVFKKYAIQSRNEAVIAKEALETENLEVLKEIDPIIASYKNIVNGLLLIRVPSGMETLHLDLINAMNGAVFISQVLRKVDVDPISGLQGVNLYLMASNRLSTSFSSIKSYFSYLGISYNTSEPGYLFQP